MKSGQVKELEIYTANRQNNAKLLRELSSFLRCLSKLSANLLILQTGSGLAGLLEL